MHKYRSTDYRTTQRKDSPAESTSDANRQPRFSSMSILLFALCCSLFVLKSWSFVLKIQMHFLLSHWWHFHMYPIKVASVIKTSFCPSHLKNNLRVPYFASRVGPQEKLGANHPFSLLQWSHALTVWGGGQEYFGLSLCLGQGFFTESGWWWGKFE